jgi:hypothetical protein
MKIYVKIAYGSQLVLYSKEIQAPSKLHTLRRFGAMKIVKNFSFSGAGTAPSLHLHGTEVKNQNVHR